MDRDEHTHQSDHYSLSDFGTSGKSGVRKNEDFLKNYFVNRYGANKDIDFTPIFEDLISDKMKCSMIRKEKKTYYFSAEGHTEKWYLDWLQREINFKPSCKSLQKNRKSSLKILQKSPYPPKNRKISPL